jgi:hypothetical protein
MKKWIWVIPAAIIILICLFLMWLPMQTAKKPVLYLYPEKEETVTVKLNFPGKLTCTYPAYRDGWTVRAEPDGTLTDCTDGKTYSYLYWEGKTNARYDMTEGFVVKGSDTAEFLQSKLSYLGLKPREYNEFIVYWLPILQKNPYNLIRFAGKDYAESTPLTITPKPDSVLRVMMLYRPLASPVPVKPQTLQPFERKGFTVVEWGGMRVN